jgi:hypothetical protein
MDMLHTQFIHDNQVLRTIQNSSVTAQLLSRLKLIILKFKKKKFLSLTLGLFT